MTVGGHFGSHIENMKNAYKQLFNARKIKHPSTPSQGSHGQGKVREKWKKFKVREKSGNFELSQGNLKFWQKSGKSQGILEWEVEIGEIRF